MTEKPTRITLATVRHLKPGQIVWDADVKGFGIRCRKSAKTYILKTRARGRQVWFRIGDAGAWTPQKARKEAQRRLRELSQGVAPEKLRTSVKGEPTIADLADRYLREHVELRNRPSTGVTVKWLVAERIRPALGQRLVIDVNSADAAKLHHRMRDTPRLANQLLAVLSKMMTLAERWGLRGQNTNPCHGLERFKEKQRSRFLSNAELKTLGEALAAMEKAGEVLPGVATAIRLLALTGCRLSEILHLRWEDVDFEKALLSIREAKAGARLHTIGAATVAFLGGLERAGPWVVVDGSEAAPAAGNTAMAWQGIRERTGLADVRLHDLRHGYGTFAGATGANAFLVKGRARSEDARHDRPRCEPRRRPPETAGRPRVGPRRGGAGGGDGGDYGDPVQGALTRAVVNLFVKQSSASP